MLPFGLVGNYQHGKNKFATVKTGKNFHYLKQVESPADDTVLIDNLFIF